MEVESALVSQELDRLRRILFAQSRAILLGSLLGNLAHDLNNPLTTISGNIELLQLSTVSEDPKIKKRLDNVQFGAKRITEKLRSIQFLTRNGRSDDRFDLNSLVGDVVRIAECLPKPKKIAITNELANEQMMAAGNPSQVANALLALLDNALDAAGQSTSPGVSISTNRLSPNRLSIVITNNGPQIDAEMGAKIFEPFFSTKQEKIGLGLYVARQLIEENYGCIDWQSAPDRTRFTISLPESERS